MRYAYIDIGSNAIRAVVYNDNTIGSYEIYSEKFKLDLKKLLFLPVNKHLPFYRIIERFLHIFQNLNVKKIKCFATAVLRGHPKASDLCKSLLAKYNITVDIISGKQEAYFTAKGLLLGISDAEGLVIDLGGGSLELAEITNKSIGNLVSLPLGLKSIDENFDKDSVMESLKRTFHNHNYSNLYLIGGGVRKLMIRYMRYISYPLQRLHYFSTSSGDLLNFLCQENINQDYFDYTAFVLEILIEFFNIQNITVSNYGLKEGVRLSDLSEEEQNKDIIFEKSKTLSQYKGSISEFKTYIDLISNILITPSDLVVKSIPIAILFIKNCIIVENPQKGIYAVNLALTSNIPFSHKQRILLAVILIITYEGKLNNYLNKLSRLVLSNLEFNNAYIVAKLLNIIILCNGYDFQKNDPIFTLSIKNNYIKFDLKKTFPKATFELINKSIRNLNKIRYNIYQKYNL